MTRTRITFLRPFTTRVVNPLSRRIVGYLPWFGIVIVHGRKSGRLYRVPMNVFHAGPDRVFALTYGAQVDWVKNVLAAGECDLFTLGRTIHLVEPRLVNDPSRRLMPSPVRFFLGLIKVTEFLVMRPTSHTPGSAP
jgi:deazaflavin-dependent oxidoreductase (nitroreductase family)